MVTLPAIDSYSQEDLDKARRLSPAVARYLDLLKTTAKNFSDELRLERHKSWVTAALAVIHKTSPPETVCAFWSFSARALLKKAWTHCALDKSNIALLEMGKLGAGELNLSSDVDIFFVSDGDTEKDATRKIRQFIQLLTEVTALGFCFRVDMDLRPGGSTSPLILGFDQLTSHYGYQGETWERAAIVRMQSHLGPEKLRNSLLEFCRKFAFRRHIDYGLFSDLFSMREKIQSHKGPSSQNNLKFRAGGIRDLELLLHSLQLIHGGKDKRLQTSSTTAAILALRDGGFLKNAEADYLQSTYWTYRELENRVQSRNDKHTYELGEAGEMISVEETTAFSKNAEKVSTIIGQLLSPYKPKTAFVDEAGLVKKFSELGFNKPESLEAWEKLLHSEARSREKTRDEQERRLFLQKVLAQLQTLNVDNDLALHHLSLFIGTVKAKASFFALLNQHPELLEEIVWIFSCSPYLSQILIFRPELIDSFLLKKLEIADGDEELFYRSLQDYKLLSELIGASAFLRNRDVAALTSNLSETTDTIVSKLLTFLEKKNPSGLGILTLGKWSGREMGLTSDLDFVFLLDTPPVEKHFKAARRFINFLQSPATGHTLYSIDLRLRPSGHAGPLLLTTSELKEYLNNKAKIWERQAYLSNRRLGEDRPLEIIEPQPLTNEQKSELAGIQKQLLSLPSEAIDMKKNFGGLLHTELTLQICMLEHQIFPSGPGLSNIVQGLKAVSPEGLLEEIYENYQRLRTHQQMLILVAGSSVAKLQEDSSTMEKLALISKSTPKVLFEEIKALLNSQRTLLNKLDPLSSHLKIEE